MNLVWLGPSPALPTGLGRVTREILSRWVDQTEWDIQCLAWWHEEGHGEGRDYGYPIHGCPENDFGQAQLARLTAAGPVEVVIASGDLWSVEWFDHTQDLHPPLFIPYAPIDGRPLPQRWQSLLEQAAVMVCPSQFGRNVVASSSGMGRVECIPYGVDGNVFHLSSRRAKLRHSLGIAEAFVVGFVGRNQQRKQLPRLLQAFARFSQGKPDAVLYLHTEPYSQAGWDIPALLERLSIDRRTYITEGLSPLNAVSDVQLNDIYNLFDVLVLPTCGEGFGLPLLEAMACGVPVVATDCSAVTELVQGRGELIRVKDWLTVGPYNVDMAIADVDHLVELLEKLYRDPDLRAEYARQGREFAETMTWDRCAAAWDALLREVLGARPAPPPPPLAAQRPWVSLMVETDAQEVPLVEALLHRLAEWITMPFEVLFIAQEAAPTVQDYLEHHPWPNVRVLTYHPAKDRLTRLLQCTCMCHCPWIVGIPAGQEITAEGVAEAVGRARRERADYWWEGHRLVVYGGRKTEGQGV